MEGRREAPTGLDRTGPRFPTIKRLRFASFVLSGVVDVKYFDHLAGVPVEHFVGIPDQWRDPNARPVGHFLGALRPVWALSGQSPMRATTDRRRL